MKTGTWFYQVPVCATKLLMFIIFIYHSLVQEIIGLICLVSRYDIS